MLLVGEELPDLPPGYSISESETAELREDSEEECYDF